MDLKDLLKKLKLSEQTVSVILGALVVIVIGILIFNYFRNTTRTTLPEGAQSNEISTQKQFVPEGLPTTHKVTLGENLWQISEKYFGSGYNWVDIAKENNLKNASRLLVGQELTIPNVAIRKPILLQTKTGGAISGESYTIVKGDNLWQIAVRAYGDGYKWTKIAKANNLVNPNLIHPGNVLSLPR